MPFHHQLLEVSCNSYLIQIIGDAEKLKYKRQKRPFYQFLIDGRFILCDIPSMSIKSLAGAIGMDYESVIEDFCGDVSALKETLKAFASADYQALKNAVDANDKESVKKEAHRIRKSAEKLGLNNLRTAASRLEEVSEEKIPADYAHLETILKSTVEAISKENL